jgi:nucleoside-diphosphate-sugar epimerase
LARALIVGCGCRGRALGARLAEGGWSLRGTTRDPAHAAEIEAARIEPAVADPDRPDTLLDLVGDVTVVYWLLGSAQAEPEVIAAIHGRRLQRLLEKLVDTPVRGFVYEAAGVVQRRYLELGAGIVRSAARTWRIPVEVVEADQADLEEWLDAMTAATQCLVG